MLSAHSYSCFPLTHVHAFRSVMIMLSAHSCSCFPFSHDYAFRSLMFMLSAHSCSCFPLTHVHAFRSLMFMLSAYSCSCFPLTLFLSVCHFVELSTLFDFLHIHITLTSLSCTQFQVCIIYLYNAAFLGGVFCLPNLILFLRWTDADSALIDTVPWNAYCEYIPKDTFHAYV